MRPGRKRFFLLPGADSPLFFQSFSRELFGTILSLVRRDYAVQFAGTALGIVWVLVQYAFQIAIFYLIFGVILAPAAPDSAEPALADSLSSGKLADSLNSGKLAAMTGGSADYLSYLLGGMVLWLPISEMLLRACSILADNRGLIRRTGLGLRGFLWVPVFEAVLHYTLIFGMVALLGLARGVLSPLAPLAYLGGLGLLFALSGWAFIFARASILLKDISPLLRLAFQLIFWLTPIVYVVGPDVMGIFAWNPVTAPVELHRRLLFCGAPGSGFAPGFATFAEAQACLAAMPGSAEISAHRLLPAPFAGLWTGVLVLVALSVPAYLLSARRLNALVVDQL